MEYSYVKQQLQTVLHSIEEYIVKHSQNPENVRLVAVSKTFPPEAVTAAYEEGQRIFGENRVQELESKTPILPDDIEWHLIGHLQSNKAAKAVQMASLIHSVDSEKLIHRIDRLAGECGKVQKILLELNISGEKSKFGQTADAAMELAEAAFACTNISLQGLMTMAPFGSEECELRRVFSNLREIRNSMEKQFKKSLPELSMGMSSDYEAAIAEGATLVRIGTAIFGKRDYS